MYRAGDGSHRHLEEEALEHELDVGGGGGEGIWADYGCLAV
jgi:hypothetical protein